ncbi:MAG: alpha/beta hydrolase [Mesorhizobium sp.]
MNHFQNDGFTLAFIDEPPANGGEGEPVLLIHGFASNIQTNWIGPGWVQTLTRAGYRVVAFDHRGHGQSSASYDEAAYTPDRMASDVVALLDHLGIGKAHLFGYSMGARVSAFTALDHPDHVASLILGGLGMGIIDGVGDWDPIAEALVAPDPDVITDTRGKMFRRFADQTKSDRMALAACIATSRVLADKEQVGRITQPTLVAVGTRDDIAGSAQELVALMPNAEAFDIINRDHMLSVGDRSFKDKAVEFLKAHPIG